ncbi:MAG TPA: restriction endonuclease subunit R, partial [Cyanobacteria bacterium UBA8553]|nr:restriction endonuclease subunit R [Cyanobacteria bacterium UBA8553]HAJ60314.1 restriction endonuclease subunit R [Cyanobacteria bacterium UBA8543]
MTINLDASNLTMEEVYSLLKFEEQLNDSITSLLSLEPLTELEHQEVLKIREVFRSYHNAGKVSEGQIRLLPIAQLLWFSGFYQSHIKITLEEGIAQIYVEDEDTIIKGRMDILAVSRIQNKRIFTPFWILLVETKNSTIDALEGLPQLLTYAYKSLEEQAAVWGLTTNGMNYQFVYIEQGEHPTYQLLPELSLIRPEQTTQLLQVLKAICKLVTLKDEG